MITNQYTFNGDGQRVGIVDSQGTKKPIWDGENILLETDGSDVTQVVYTLEPAGYGNLVSQRRGSTTSTYLFDALGSTRKLTDSAGAVTDSYDYRAYGETYQSSGSTVNVFRWVGELGYYFDVDRDAYYLRARPYRPALARFLSQDPIGFEGSEWNLYEYAINNPLMNSDPTGLICRIHVHCRPVFGFGPQHCGITACLNGVCSQYDGTGGDENQIVVTPGMQNPNRGCTGLGTNHPDSVCQCIDRYRFKFNPYRLPRDQFQGNSNWTLSCMASYCGLKLTWGPSGAPYGYDDPKCKRYVCTTVPGGSSISVCVEWYRCPS